MIKNDHTVPIFYYIYTKNIQLNINNNLNHTLKILKNCNKIYYFFANIFIAYFIKYFYI